MIKFKCIQLLLKEISPRHTTIQKHTHTSQTSSIVIHLAVIFFRKIEKFLTAKVANFVLLFQLGSNLLWFKIKTKIRKSK